MTSSLIVALGVLSTSFIGSVHCAAMCGPMATLMAQRKSLVSYHLGRLLAYLTLGLVAGASGEFFLNSRFVQLRWVAVLLMALMLFLMGLAKIFPHTKLFAKYLTPRTSAISHSFGFFLGKLSLFKGTRSGFSMGLMTALLPCGWLYTYVVAAAATQSVYAGALLMILFWLGGLPALSAVPLLIRQTVQSAGVRQQRVAGFVLIAASVYSLASFMFLH